MERRCDSSITTGDCYESVQTAFQFDRLRSRFQADKRPNQPSVFGRRPMAVRHLGL